MSVSTRLDEQYERLLAAEGADLVRECKRYRRIVRNSHRGAAVLAELSLEASGLRAQLRQREAALMEEIATFKAELDSRAGVTRGAGAGMPGVNALGRHAAGPWGQPDSAAELQALEARTRSLRYSLPSPDDAGAGRAPGNLRPDLDDMALRLSELAQQAHAERAFYEGAAARRFEHAWGWLERFVRHLSRGDDSDAAAFWDMNLLAGCRADAIVAHAELCRRLRTSALPATLVSPGTGWFAVSLATAVLATVVVVAAVKLDERAVFRSVSLVLFGVALVALLLAGIKSTCARRRSAPK